jgi:hypothetical protein
VRSNVVDGADPTTIVSPSDFIAAKFYYEPGTGDPDPDAEHSTWRDVNHVTGRYYPFATVAIKFDLAGLTTHKLARRLFLR